MSFPKASSSVFTFCLFLYSTSVISENIFQGTSIFHNSLGAHFMKSWYSVELSMTFNHAYLLISLCLSCQHNAVVVSHEIAGHVFSLSLLFSHHLFEERVIAKMQPDVGSVWGTILAQLRQKCTLSQLACHVQGKWFNYSLNNHDLVVDEQWQNNLRGCQYTEQLLYTHLLLWTTCQTSKFDNWYTRHHGSWLSQGTGHRVSIEGFHIKTLSIPHVFPSEPPDEGICDVKAVKPLWSLAEEEGWRINSSWNQVPLITNRGKSCH